MPARRGSPVRLVAAFALVCAAPLVAVAATGLTSEHPFGDKVETADGGRSGSGSGSGSDADGAVDPDAGPPGTGTADLGATTTSGPASTTRSTAAPKAPAPPATRGPAPGGTTSPPGTPGSSPTTGGGGGGSTPAPTSPPVSQVEQVVTLVNQARAKASPKCAALRVDVHLTAAAQSHSDDMVARKYFSHVTPDGVDFAARIKTAGYPRPGGENIAQGQTSAQQVMSDWMASAGHRANILNCSFTAIGVGLNTVGWTWTQDFGY